MRFSRYAAARRKAAENEIPILIYNPHPYPVAGIFECEFQLPDQNWQDTFSYPAVSQDGRAIPAQTEKEQSNLNLDWRKRVVFAAELAPMQVSRFDCTLQVLPRKPAPQLQPQDGKLTLKTERLEVMINCATGLMDRYRVDGIDYLAENAFQPLVIGDDDDPWGMNVQGFREVVGRFSLMSPAEGTAFSGVRERVLDSVRVIEDGAVRTVVEAVFSYGHSFACLHYKLPKRGTEIEVQLRVLWNEKSRMLKLALPTPFLDGRYSGQVAFGVAELPADGREVVAQKWVGVCSADDQQALTCVNHGVYGSDFAGGELRLSLLRSPGYAGHPIFDRPIHAPGPLFTPDRPGRAVFHLLDQRGTRTHAPGADRLGGAGPQ